MINRIITFFKGTGYEIDKDIDFRDLIMILFHRIIQLIRGSIAKIQIKTSGFFFKGRAVIFRNSRKFSAGKNLI